MRPILLMALLLTGGCALFEPKPPPVTLRFHEESDPALPPSRVRLVTVPRSNQQLAIDPQPQLTEKDLTEAQLVPALGGQAVQLHFDFHGTATLAEMTTRMRGRYLAILVDDRVVAVVLADKIIPDGIFLLEADMTDEEERTLVNNLNKIAGKKKDFGDTNIKP
jgi:preprotein translocase subunit SecD